MSTAPRGTTARAQQQQQHYPHTKHIIVLPLTKPILFGSTGTSATTDRRASCGHAHSTSYARTVKAVQIESKERISERLCVVDVSVLCPRSQARPNHAMQRTVEQVLAVLVTLIVEQLVEVPKTVSQDRTQQRTLEQISDRSWWRNS